MFRWKTGFSYAAHIHSPHIHNRTEELIFRICYDSSAFPGFEARWVSIRWVVYVAHCNITILIKGFVFLPMLLICIDEVTRWRCVNIKRWQRSDTGTARFASNLMCNHYYFSFRRRLLALESSGQVLGTGSESLTLRRQHHVMIPDLSQSTYRQCSRSPNLGNRPRTVATRDCNSSSKEPLSYFQSSWFEL